MPTGSSESSTRAPVLCRTLRASAWAQTAPKRPVEAPITSAGLLRRGLLAMGRLAQSSAFLSPPGMEELYSGVAIRTASAAAMASSSPVTACGRSLSRSSSKIGRAPRPSHWTSSAPDGSASAAARRSMVLWEPRRALPEMPRIRIALGLLDERELDEEADLVGERLAARGQRGVPAHAELAAVDLGLEVQVPARGAERVGGRRGPRARGPDGLRDALDGQLALGHGRAVIAEIDARGLIAHGRESGGVKELLREDVRAERLRRAD